MASKKLNLTRVDTLLKSTLKKLNLEESFEVYPIWKKWKQIVGPAIASKTEPSHIRGKTLIVSVKNSVWMNELELQKKNLLNKINSLNTESPVEEIRFRIGPK